MPDPLGSTDAAAFQAVRRNLGRIEVLSQPVSDETPPFLELLEEQRPLKNFVIPDPGSLGGLGRGCVEDFEQSEALMVRSLIELVVQHLAESPKVQDTQGLPAAVATVKNAKVKARLNEIVGSDGQGSALLALVQGDRHKDGSENSMIEIDSRAGVGATPAERRAAVLGQSWGAPRK